MSHPAIPARIATSRTTGRGGHRRPIAQAPDVSAEKAEAAKPATAAADLSHGRRRRLSHDSPANAGKVHSRRHSGTTRTREGGHARTTVKGSPTWSTHGVTGQAAHPAAAVPSEESKEPQAPTSAPPQQQTVTRSEKITLPLSVLVLSNRFAAHHPYSVRALHKTNDTTASAGKPPLAAAVEPESSLQQQQQQQQPISTRGSYGHNVSYEESNNNNNNNTVNAMPADALCHEDAEPQPRQVHIVPQKRALLTSQEMPSAFSHDNLSARSLSHVSVNNNNNDNHAKKEEEAGQPKGDASPAPRQMLLPAGSLARQSPTPRRTSQPHHITNNNNKTMHAAAAAGKEEHVKKGRSASRLPSLSTASRTSPPRLLAPPTTLSETNQFIQRMDYELALLERRHMVQRALHGLPKPRRSRSRRTQAHLEQAGLQSARSGLSSGSASRRRRTTAAAASSSSLSAGPRASSARSEKHKVAEAPPASGTRRRISAPALTGRTCSSSNRHNNGVAGTSRRSASRQSATQPPRQTMSYTMLAHTVQAPLGKAAPSTSGAAAGLHHRRPLLPSHRAQASHSSATTATATAAAARVERMATAKPSCVGSGEAVCHGPPPVSDDEDEDASETVREMSPVLEQAAPALAAAEEKSGTAHNGVRAGNVMRAVVMPGNGTAGVEEAMYEAALRTPPHHALSEENSETNTLPYRGSTGKRPERVPEEEDEDEDEEAGGMDHDVQAAVAEPQEHSV